MLLGSLGGPSGGRIVDVHSHRTFVLLYRTRDLGSTYFVKPGTTVAAGHRGRRTAAGARGRCLSARWHGRRLEHQGEGRQGREAAERTLRVGDRPRAPGALES